MKLKRIIVPLAVLSLVMGAAIFSRASEEDKKPYAVQATNDPTELTTEDMTVTQVEHSKSNIAESFTFRYAASFTARSNKWNQVYLAVKDPTFIESEQTEHSKASEIPHFDGILAKVEGAGAAAGDDEHGGLSLIAIPRSIQMATRYIIDCKTINVDTVNDASVYMDAYGIFIPKEVQTIEAGAFKNVPNGFTFYVEAESEPAGWESGWHDNGTVLTGQSVVSSYDKFKASFSLGEDAVTDEEKIEKVNSQVLARKSTTSITIETGLTVSLGYKETVTYKTYNTATEKYDTITTDYNYPMIAHYKLKGESTERTFEIPIKNADSNGNGFDAVGSVGAGDTTIDISFNIPLESGQEVDNLSFRFTNIYHLVQVDAKKLDEHGNVVPDLSAPFVPKLSDGEFAVEPVSYAKQMMILSDITSFTPSEFVRFGGYTQVTFTCTNNSEAAYRKYDPETYNNYRARLASGEYYFRFRFNYIFSSKLAIKYQGAAGYHYVNLPTPIEYDYVIIGNKASGNKIGFLFKDSDVGPGFSYEKIEEIQILKLRAVIEIVKTNGTSANAEQSISATFGLVDLYRADRDSAKKADLGTILLIIMLSYIALFAIGAVALFFYMKNKFKNDEFRRVKPKQYWISAVKNLVGFALVTAAVSFIIFRTSLMDSAVVMFNPTDVYVIAFTIAAGIFLGVTIKNIVVATKRMMDNKKKAKLHLDKDVVDDGTK